MRNSGAPLIKKYCPPTLLHYNSVYMITLKSAVASCIVHENKARQQYTPRAVSYLQ